MSRSARPVGRCARVKSPRARSMRRVVVMRALIRGGVVCASQGCLTFGPARDEREEGASCQRHAFSMTPVSLRSTSRDILGQKKPGGWGAFSPCEPRNSPHPTPFPTNPLRCRPVPLEWRDATWPRPGRHRANVFRRARTRQYRRGAVPAPVRRLSGQGTGPTGCGSSGQGVGVPRRARAGFERDDQGVDAGRLWRGDDGINAHGAGEVIRIWRDAGAGACAVDQHGGTFVVRSVGGQSSGSARLCKTRVTASV